MLVVDTDLLAKLATTGLDVNESVVDSDNSGSTVSVTYPYLVYYSSIGNKNAPRLAGRNTRISVFFRLMYVGETRTQAKAAGEKARLALEGKRVTTGVNVRRSGLIECDESQQVRRDDDAIRPDGTPLFYGVDLYSVTLTLNSTGVPS